MKKIISLLLVLQFTLAFSEQAIPMLTQRVMDEANILSTYEEQELESMLKSIEDSTSTQIVILIIGTTQPEEIEQYSIRVVEEWKLGQKEHDNGVLILAAMEDRKFRIEVGYGLEGSLTDAFCKMVIVKQVIPNFKSGNYYNGFREAITSIEAQMSGEEFDITAIGSNNSKPGFRGKQFMIVIIATIFIVPFFRAIKNKYVKMALGAAPGILMLIVTTSIFLSVFISVISFASLFGSSSSAGRGGGRSRGGGMFYGGSGGFGGGFSGGGGFSSGGGGFGGGGASGDW